LFRDDGRFHLGHRAWDVFFLLEPPVEDSEHLVAGCGRAGRAASEQVGEEVLEIGFGGVLEAPAAAAEEDLSLVEALEVVLDGALRAVLGSQVPLE
jgi:hypothetical protein